MKEFRGVYFSFERFAFIFIGFIFVDKDDICRALNRISIEWILFVI